MTWYYAVDGKQTGPVSEEEIASLFQRGQITTETLVWREGMPNWQPLREIRNSVPALAAASAPVAAPGVAPAPAVLPPVGGDEVACSECHQIVPKSNAVQYGDHWICAQCKPAFFQKVREGVVPQAIGTFAPAGFWIRFCAKFVDGIITGIIGLPFNLIFGFRPRGAMPDMLMQQGMLMGIGFVIGIAYYVFFVGRFGATPGKMLLKIKIIRADGGNVSYGLATGRYFAELLSGCPTLLIGYIMAAFDDEKRALHDRICGTRVVYK